jgi:hypothetical protein
MKYTSLIYYIVLGWGTLKSWVADYAIFLTTLHKIIFS